MAHQSKNRAKNRARNQTTSNQDLDFIARVRPASLAEVKISHLARDHSHRDEVKRFAEVMVDEHLETNKQLMRLIDRMNLAPSADIDSEHLRIEQRLSQLNGDAFDREFLAAQMKDHEDMVALFEREISAGGDADLKDFARSHLTMMQRHLSQAQGLAANLRI